MMEDTVSATPIFEAVVEEMEKQFGGVLPTAKELQKELGIGLKECKEILQEYKKALESRSRVSKQPPKSSRKAASKDVAANSAAAPVVKAPQPVGGSGNPPAPATKAAPAVAVQDVEETQRDDEQDETLPMDIFQDGQGNVSEPGDHDGEALEDEEEEEEEECEVAGEEDGSVPMSSKLLPRVEAEGLELLPANTLPPVKAAPAVPAKATVPVLATPPCKRQLSFASAGEPGSKQLKIPSQAWLHGVYMFLSPCAFHC